jgi:hypothetical protein
MQPPGHAVHLAGQLVLQGLDELGDSPDVGFRGHRDGLLEVTRQ